MIRTGKGDIWTYAKSRLVVIPTNIGWKSSGANVMGRGLARQAADRYPSLAFWYGCECKRHGAETPVMIYPAAPLILFPVKPLNEQRPALSWQGGASLELIERSAKQLAELPVELDVAVSLVGCGNGGLDMSDVRPILDRYLSADRFLLVLPVRLS